MQFARRAVKAAFTQHGGQGFESSVVEHLEKLKIVQIV
jgi:hypothetical protein